MMAVGRCLAVCKWRGRCRLGEKRLTAAGRGDSCRLLELLLVVARCRRPCFTTAGGVKISNSSSDLSLSITSVGVFGSGVKDLRSIISSEMVFRFQTRGDSGVMVRFETSRACCGRFDETIMSSEYGSFGEDGSESVGDRECHDWTV